MVSSSESCRCNLLKAATEARASREIGPIEFLRVRRLCQPNVWNRTDPDVGKTVGTQVQDYLIEQLPDSALRAATTPQGINWDALLAFLKEFLPLILDFIKALLALFA